MSIISIAENSGDDDWKTVCEVLRPLASKWEKIAQSLGIVANKIEEIKQTNINDASQCLDKAINYWIQQNCNTDKHGLPSWRTLCKAISNVEGMRRIVKDLVTDHRGIVTIML